VAAQAHAAYDDGEHPSASRPRPQLPCSVPSSRQPPSVDDRDHQGARCHESCDDGGDRL